MKLYGFNGGLYPPRVSIYLSEKRINDIEIVHFDMFRDWPPPEMKKLSPLGTIPILETHSGTLIRSSVAIMEYLEEIYPLPPMLGTSAEDRATIRVLVSLTEEAALQLGIWVHKASKLFASREEQNCVAARFAKDAYHKQLEKVETLMVLHRGRYIAGEAITIADCVMMATLQFADTFYAIPVPTSCPTLSRWYGDFLSRPSAPSPDYPSSLTDIAKIRDAA